MDRELGSGEINIIKTSGLACIGSVNEIIDNYILPESVNTNHGFAPNAKVFKNDCEIGKLITSRYKKRKIMFGVKLDTAIGDGLYSCHFNVNKMFSSYTGSKFLLEQVIVDSIVIDRQINDIS